MQLKKTRRMLSALLTVMLLAAVQVEQFLVRAKPSDDLHTLLKLFKDTEPIDVDICKGLGYSTTLKTNFLGITQQQSESNQVVKALLILERLGCTTMARAYICALITPKPLGIYVAAPPCRSICKSIEKSCEKLINLLFSIPRRGKCKLDVIGGRYRGNINKTRSGIQCQKWSSQKPHSHRYKPKLYPNEDLFDNYCRNPDREPNGPWCYTTNNKRRWEYCDVPWCQKDLPLLAMSINGTLTGSNLCRLSEAMI